MLQFLRELVLDGGELGRGEGGEVDWGEFVRWGFRRRFHGVGGDALVWGWGCVVEAIVGGGVWEGVESTIGGVQRGRSESPLGAQFLFLRFCSRRPSRQILRCQVQFFFGFQVIHSFLCFLLLIMSSPMY